MKRLLVTGAGGTLGRAMARELAGSCDVRALDRSRLDVTDADAVSAEADRFAPHVIVNAAAYTDVDAAEDDMEGAAAVNDRGVANVVAAARAAGALVVHVSTDYVFDGTKGTPYVEDDPPQPVNAYGRSKLAGERHVRAAPRHLLLRTQGLFAAGADCFPEAILRAAEAGRPLRVIADSVTGVAYAPDVARSVRLLLERDVQGVVHVANEGPVSWADLARAVLDACGRAEVPVERVPTGAFPRRAPRPRWSYLSSERAAAATGERLPSWRDAVGRFAADRAAVAPGSPRR